MGKAYGPYGKEEKCMQGFRKETWRKEIDLKYRHSWTVILKWILNRIGGCGVDLSGTG